MQRLGALLLAATLAACAPYFEARRAAADLRSQQESLRAVQAQLETARTAAAAAAERANAAAAEAAAAATALRRLREPVGRVERIVVEKAARRLHLMRAGEAVRTYSVALGSQPIGPKRAEGDGRTPEGLYYVDRRNAQSRFFRALHLSYPNDADRARAAANGARPGGDIMIHGQPRGVRGVAAGDWTDGCIAVSNAAMREIWAAAAAGTPVEIRP